MSGTQNILEVSDLKVHFPIAGGGKVYAVDGISFALPPASPSASLAKAARARPPPRWPARG
ncbi:hypothetical protein ACFSZS_28040 [Seohaeicola zhoushanensis]